MPKVSHVPLFITIILLLVACQAKPVCPAKTGTPQYLSGEDLKIISSSTPGSFSTPIEMKINGKLTKVDKVVTGPLCNDHWKGSVYVACDVQVLKWEKVPLFLKDCNLSIEPGTIVYVAYHNETAYYNGCSCHTGEQP